MDRRDDGLAGGQSPRRIIHGRCRDREFGPTSSSPDRRRQRKSVAEGRSRGIFRHEPLGLLDGGLLCSPPFRVPDQPLRMPRCRSCGRAICCAPARSVGCAKSVVVSVPADGSGERSGHVAEQDIRCAHRPCSSRQVAARPRRSGARMKALLAQRHRLAKNRRTHSRGCGGEIGAPNLFINDDGNRAMLDLSRHWLHEIESLCDTREGGRRCLQALASSGLPSTSPTRS